MGEIVLAAKMTHVPTMLMSEQEGPIKGKRQPAIDGHLEIARRAKALGADTVVICDTHWVINAGFHINANGRFEGLFTSNEFPQFIQNLPYEYEGNPDLGDAIAEDRDRQGRLYAGAPPRQPGAGIRHAGADAFHEPRARDESGLGRAPGAPCMTTTKAASSARRSAQAIEASRQQGAAGRLRLAQPQDLGQQGLCRQQRHLHDHLASSTGRSICMCSRCGRTATTPPS